jgi:hypothetical protein
MKTAKELNQETKSKRLSQLDKIYKSMQQASKNGDFKTCWYENITGEEVKTLEDAGYKVDCHWDQRDGYTNIISWE